MNSEIGETAGAVWRVLDDNGGLTTSEIKKSLGLKDNLLHMALGWLAREGQLNFDAKGRAIRISLR